MKVTPIKDPVIKRVDAVSQMPVNFSDASEFEDQMLYGLSAKDENGIRIDPRTIRVKLDGTFVLVTK